MLASVDGKISTGSTDKLDVDKDFPRIRGIKEGLKQYYTLEQTTDLYSLNSGRVLTKIGVNKLQRKIIKLPVSFLIIDNKPHLNKIGVDNLIRKSKKLIDKISIVVAPALVGGKDTSSLIDGKSLSSVKELSNINLETQNYLTDLKNSYDFYVLNFANPDMVGHTGNLKATIKAIEYVDGCVAEIVKKILDLEGAALITSDHGNSEEMINLETGEPDTEHNIYPAPFIFIMKEYARKKPSLTFREAIFEPTGTLADIAPTILDLLHVKQPEEMTGISLLNTLK